MLFKSVLKSGHASNVTEKKRTFTELEKGELSNNL